MSNDYEGDWVSGGKYMMRFVRNKKGDFLELQWSIHRKYVPVTAIAEALEGQWQADSTEHLARKVL